jgi:hypothetical protein
MYIFSYIFGYFGFFIFDFYQTQKIGAITSAGRGAKLFMYGLLLIRLLSYAYNMVYIGGQRSGIIFNDRGGCTTTWPRQNIYQKHIVSIILSSDYCSTLGSV